MIEQTNRYMLAKYIGGQLLKASKSSDDVEIETLMFDMMRAEYGQPVVDQIKQCTETLVFICDHAESGFISGRSSLPDELMERMIRMADKIMKIRDGHND